MIKKGDAFVCINTVIMDENPNDETIHRNTNQRTMTEQKSKNYEKV